MPAVSLAIGGLIVGALDGRGLLNKIPTIGGSRAMTLGIAGYLVTRFIKHPMARNAGLAALAASAYDYGKVHLGGPSGGGQLPAVVPPPAGKGAMGGHDDSSGHGGDGGPF